MADITFLNGWLLDEDSVDELYTFCLYLCKEVILDDMKEDLIYFFLLEVLHDFFYLGLWHSFVEFLGQKSFD